MSISLGKSPGYSKQFFCYLFHSLFTGLIGVLLFIWHGRLWSVRAGNDRKKVFTACYIPLFQQENKSRNKILVFVPSFSSLSEGMCLLQQKLIEEVPFVLQLVKYMGSSGKTRFLSVWEIRKNCSSQRKTPVVLEVNIRCLVISGSGGYMRAGEKWDAEKWRNLSCAKESFG